MVGSMRGVIALSLTLVACAIGCGETRTAPRAANAPERARPGRAELLACLGAPPEAIYEPARLAGAPAAGLDVHVFAQATARCGSVDRRYVSYVPRALAARTAAPVLLVLHGQGGSAEAMMTFQTRGTFNRLADEKGFVVVYGNGLPTTFNIAGLPNSGRWRSEYTDLGATVDEVGYLRRIVEDLTARAVIAGGNDVYLVGQSNGGGMVLSAARQQPDAYAGVAAFMPFVGFSPAAPPSLVGARLRRALFAYSLADPALPPSYPAEVIAPLARGWARALGVSEHDLEAPAETALDDVVKEGANRDIDDDVVRATRDSTVKRLDLRSTTGALRQLVFDHAGHFWPTRDYADPAPLLTEFGLRNQDIEGAAEVWRFFRE
jgi:poly(3-hydroxybutyrate) depolymerase